MDHAITMGQGFTAITQYGFRVIMIATADGFQATGAAECGYEVIMTAMVVGYRAAGVNPKCLFIKGLFAA